MKTYYTFAPPYISCMHLSQACKTGSQFENQCNPPYQHAKEKPYYHINRYRKRHLKIKHS